MSAHIEHTLLVLREAVQAFPKIGFANSLAAEDMVLTDLIFRNQLGIEVFTLETGMLHADTFAMIGRIEAHYGQPVAIYQPQPEAVETYIKAHGKHAFYESVELRKQCCHIRKVEPLQRALAGKQAWITGQRREQAITRGELAEREFDAGNGIEKFNPLAAWSTEQVWDYIRSNNVPYNPLHDRGYPSIGCDPCTRAIKPGEDIRAGRWWWEQADTKECGLHVGQTAAK
ncbi:phosphoadenylyl-sulfate reductase [Parvibium lacunae]|uniref:Adenosine 5'-phosphosulfate reductase n=1 Tax=Parvibium lacunae TaxID=1888893 RepID=A0A368KYD9_9BURK|nr:phosphoadenylyl-sulfate reductase [Parvibium lacunae]RCS56470.1 phosphoadenylyl-sulfate reductase [Parvibium lacunae]